MLAQNVEAWTRTLEIVANAPQPIAASPAPAH
jgi:hypothetical protein